MVVMETDSERNSLSQMLNGQKRSSHTHNIHTHKPGPFPFLPSLPLIQRLKFTQFCDVLHQAEERPASVTETYSDFLKYSEKSHCFGQIYKLFYCSARNSFELLFFITDVLSSRPCCEIKWY